MLLAALEQFLRDWPYLTLLVVAGVVGVVAGPSFLTATGSVRRLTAAERAALARLNVPVDSVRVVGRDDSAPTAYAVGILPGHRSVCVTPRLVELLPPEELAAVVAHEIGHLNRYHVLPRVGVPTCFVLLWAAAVSAELPWAFEIGTALVVPVTLLTFALARWSEYDADAYVARHGDPAALAAALTRLGRGGFVRSDRSTWGRLLSRHPTMRRRLSRLPRRRGP